MPTPWKCCTSGKSCRVRSSRSWRSSGRLPTKTSDTRQRRAVWPPSMFLLRLGERCDFFGGDPGAAKRSDGPAMAAALAARGVAGHGRVHGVTGDAASALVDLFDPLASHSATSRPHDSENNGHDHGEAELDHEQHWQKGGRVATRAQGENCWLTPAHRSRSERLREPSHLQDRTRKHLSRCR